MSIEKKKMSILSDVFLVKGKSHRICQDYILQGDNYIIVCDGCSSSPHSDIGARILAHCAKDSLKYTKYFLDDPDFWGHYIIGKAESSSKMLNLPQQSLDVTLLIALVDGDMIRVIGYGDGIVMAMENNDGLDYVSMEYLNVNRKGEIISAPYYLSYRLDGDREQSYSINLTDENIKRQVSKRHDYRIPYKEILELSFPVSDYKFVGIATDGLKSFVDYNTQEVYDFEKIMEQVVDFKSLGKEFLLKRMRRMLQSLAVQRVFHYDDIGIGGFLINK